MAGKLIQTTAAVVLAAALTAPVATAKRARQPVVRPAAPPTQVLDASSIFAIGCTNGTIPGATGGDNNNYDYYGSPCGGAAQLTSGAPSPSITPVRSGNVAINPIYTEGCRNGTIPGATGGDNNNYDSYGDVCGS
jgi:hypothetical protein